MTLLQTFNQIFAFFADDASLYVTVENPNEAAAVLNGDIDAILGLSRGWSHSTLQKQLFSKKHIEMTHPSVYMNQIHIETVPTHT